MSELPTIPEGRHAAPKKKPFGRAFWGAVGAAAAGAVVVLAQAMTGTAEAREAKPSPLESKIDSLNTRLDDFNKRLSWLEGAASAKGLGVPTPAPSVRTSTVGK